MFAAVELGEINGKQSHIAEPLNCNLLTFRINSSFPELHSGFGHLNMSIHRTE
jgi:hypothetical protein